MPRPEEGGRRPAKRAAIVAGLVVEVRRMKKGQRIIVVLDDSSSRIECPLFAEAAAEFGHLLVPDKLVVVEGHLQYDDFTDGFRLAADRVMDIEAARTRYAHRILLQLQAEAAPDVGALAVCVARHRAECGCDVVLRYANADARAVLTLGATRLRLCDELLSDLKGLVGADRVQVRYRRVVTTVQ
jgi:DNA polymerase-3 subunit alpha